MISTGDAFALLGAGALAGLVGSAGAITTLISYPALLAVGVPALPATITNGVAIVCCWPGAALSSQPELRGRSGWLMRYVPVAAVGGSIGAALLLSTPSRVFDRVVPFLVAAGAISLFLQPWLSARHDADRHGRDHRALPGAVLGVSLYNGYFGAGSGVMLLAVLLVAVDDHLPTANALKNMLIGAASVVSACALAVFGSVNWDAAVPLGVGMFAGSSLGPLVARRLPASLLRILVALIGVGLAIVLWFDPGG
jgi:hypothetical protein